MIGSQSFKILLDDWKLLQQNSTESLWVNKNVPDIMALRFQSEAPEDLPPDYPNIDSHKALFENAIAQADGAVISVDFLDVKGVEAFQTVVKF